MGKQKQISKPTVASKPKRAMARTTATKIARAVNAKAQDSLTSPTEAGPMVTLPISMDTNQQTASTATIVAEVIRQLQIGGFLINPGSGTGLAGVATQVQVTAVNGIVPAAVAGGDIAW